MFGLCLVCTTQYIADAVESLSEQRGWRYIQVMAALAQRSPQEVAVEERLRSVELPRGVKLKAAFFDLDYSGDAAIYVVFSVSKQLGLGPARIKSLGQLRERVFAMLDEMGLDRLTYVRFVDVK